ncbi:hypothetical protein [Telluribacter humicola]|uniref:hypothetical protein n=1 Tax=Telluribacter humicola TaxID=1720261 RepID=UPI001A979952|nr:hypothetical protein [Telluribacter humicola]
MKTYADFITAITTQPALLQELESILPFPDQSALQRWFIDKGYQIGDHDLQMLYDQQNSLLDASEQVNY